jgi:prepilin-type N-terminal cleavage/methylation domain-containing protein
MRRATQRGMTLIEIMVVLVIIALAMGGIALGSGALTSSDMRSSSQTLVAAVRFAYSRAVSQGVTARIVLDFDAKTIQVQETTGRVVLQRDDETGSGLHRKDAPDLDPDAGQDDVAAPVMMPAPAGGTAGSAIGDALGLGSGAMSAGGTTSTGGGGILGMMSGMSSSGQITDPFLAAMAQGATGDVTGGKAGYRGPRFAPSEGGSGEARSLEGDIAFKKVFSPHEPKAREGGKAYIYFFPGGVTEHAIIQLTDNGEEKESVYSIEIHPLTGRAVIHDEELEPEEELDKLQEAEQ